MKTKKLLLQLDEGLRTTADLLQLLLVCVHLCMCVLTCVCARTCVRVYVSKRERKHSAAATSSVCAVCMCFCERETAHACLRVGVCERERKCVGVWLKVENTDKYVSMCAYTHGIIKRERVCVIFVCMCGNAFLGEI